MGQYTSGGFCSPSKVGGEGAGRGGVRQEETVSGRTSIQEKTEQKPLWGCQAALVPTEG